MKQRDWQLCWVVALPAEARALLDGYAFSRVADKPFPLYQARKNEMHLVISGIGKINSAAATAWLGAQLPPNRIWLNLGTAGHKNYKLGSSYWIHKIKDAATGNCYYPAILPRWNSSSLSCYDKEQRLYPAADLVDMESSGFFPTACLFAPSELVQLYKLVTDNERHPLSKASAKTALARKNWEELHQGVAELRRLAQAQLGQEIAMMEKITNWEASLGAKLHFSVSHLIQLRRLLKSWFILRQDSPLKLEAQDAAGLIRLMKKELKS